MKKKFILGAIGIVSAAYMIIAVDGTMSELDHMKEVNEGLLITRSNLIESNELLLLENEKLESTILEINGKVEELESELERVNQTLQNERSKVKEASRGNYTRTTTESNVDTSGGDKTLLGTFEATAYSDNVESQGQWVGQTASGMKPQVGVIAVDPNVIPLGTKLYVEGYGNCVAGDVGGAIKGNRLDLFKNTREECREWGRRQVKVYRR